MSAYVTCPVTQCMYEDIIWLIENTALTLFFLALNETFVVRAQFWSGRTKEFAILVNRIFPMLLAA